MKLDKTKYEDDKMDQQKEEEERLLIVMVTDNNHNYFSNSVIWRRSGLVVSALDSRSSGLGLTLARPEDTALCSWESHFALVKPLFAQVFNLVLANSMLGEGGALK